MHMAATPSSPSLTMALVSLLLLYPQYDLLEALELLPLDSELDQGGFGLSPGKRLTLK